MWDIWARQIGVSFLLILLITVWAPVTLRRASTRWLSAISVISCLAILLRGGREGGGDDGEPSE